MESITSFKGPYAFLSNFYKAEVHPFWWPATLPSFPTNEHLFQAWKVPEDVSPWYWVECVEQIRSCDTPGTAKIMGRDTSLREDWEHIKIDVMKYCVQDKFRRHDDLMDALLNTGEAELIEGNTWGDKFWGAVWDKELGWVGQNWLGKLLMEEREFNEKEREGWK